MPSAQTQQSKEQMEAMQKGMRTQMSYIVIMFLILFVYSVQPIREAVAIPGEYLLQPIIGFGYKFPLYTILAASVITGLVNTVARHFFTDYFKMAEIQHKNRKLSKKYREAMASRNKAEIDAIRAEQSKSMTDSMQTTQAQMKPMYITMILSVIIFAWLYVFMATVQKDGFQWINSPFGQIDLMKLYVTYVWLILYSMFSIIITYPVQYALKLFYLVKSVSR